MFMDIPQGVLQSVLAPMLCRESRIALSEAIPSRRIHHKFARHFADEHHMQLCRDKWTAMLLRIEACDNLLQRRNLVFRLIQDLGRPMHAMLARRNPAFRAIMVAKIADIMAEKQEGMSERWWRMFQRQCSRTLALHLQ